MAPRFRDRERRVERSADAFTADHDVFVMNVQEMDGAHIVSQHVRSILEHGKTVTMSMPEEETRDLVSLEQFQDFLATPIRMHVVAEH